MAVHTIGGLRGTTGAGYAWHQPLATIIIEVL
eukprot:CAMPEP_0194340384 /NCGR_PEP_ID=MMETSP0171-20130528/86150_1 /TAXON_ID=218684 /ORGANISM="Corethron pennatum, Strain L29A3" /LENGTH=31 /DNA_ID= /DNA_START= /DNA_END= /DNA_ORIENTATION=